MPYQKYRLLPILVRRCALWQMVLNVRLRNHENSENGEKLNLDLIFINNFCQNIRVRRFIIKQDYNSPKLILCLVLHFFGMRGQKRQQQYKNQEWKRGPYLILFLGISPRWQFIRENVSSISSDWYKLFKALTMDWIQMGCFLPILLEFLWDFKYHARKICLFHYPIFT